MHELSAWPCEIETRDTTAVSTYASSTLFARPVAGPGVHVPLRALTPRSYSHPMRVVCETPLGPVMHTTHRSYVSQRYTARPARPRGRRQPLRVAPIFASLTRTPHDRVRGSRARTSRVETCSHLCPVRDRDRDDHERVRDVATPASRGRCARAPHRHRRRRSIDRTTARPHDRTTARPHDRTTARRA